MDGRFLSEELYQAVRGMVREWMDLPQNNAITVRQGPGWESSEDHLSPENYVAIPTDPEIGIAGLDHGTEGLSADGDIPGSGEADIFEVRNGVLHWIETTQTVFNLSEERLRNDVYPVIRMKNGSWVVVNKTVILNIILSKRLDPATGPLTGATIGEGIILEFKSSDATGLTADKWKTVSRKARFENHSVGFQGTAGTYGVLAKTQGKMGLIHLDCQASEEAINEIVNIFSDTYGGFTYGG